MKKVTVFMSSIVLLKYLVSVHKRTGSRQVTLQDNKFKLDDLGNGVEFESAIRFKKVEYSWNHDAHSINNLMGILQIIPEQPICLTFDGGIDINHLMI